jgi:hypothetical protein
VRYLGRTPEASRIMTLWAKATCPGWRVMPRTPELNSSMS